MGGMITYATSCSGIDAWGCAVDPLGWSQLWCSEIEKFPSAVLAHRRPSVQNHGDMLKLRDRILSGEIPAPDVFVAGTPCQAFSMAGLRDGLNDKRGQLTLEYIRICDAIDAIRYREGKAGGVFVWENVWGALNDDTNAFGCLLAGLCGEVEPLEPGPRPEPGRSSEHWRWRTKTNIHVPKWSDAGCVVGPKRTVCWRVYDAQYFGLAQRRERVFVVASDRAALDPAAVLFEREGLRRDIAPRREKGESHTYPTAPCLRASGIGTDRIGELCGEDPVIAVYENHGQDSRYKSIETCPTISAKAGTGGNNFPLVVHGEVPVYQSIAPELANTLTARMAKGINTTMDEWQTPVVCHGVDFQNVATTGDLSGTIMGEAQAKKGEAGHGVFVSGVGVRRLMPVECERLMGFEDGYTLIPWRNGLARDGLRYRAIGNSKAVPLCRWIARRIEAQLKGNQ